MSENRTVTLPARPARTAAALVAASVAALVLAGCATPAAETPSTTPATSAAASTPHNDADVAFARGMVPHHAQAVQMAELAADRAGDAGVRDLAARIRRAQGPEIDRLRGFLASWGVLESDHAGHSGMAGMPGMSGMMDDRQMRSLTDARGAAFDRQFLQMMVAHHRGAVEMAGAELAGGTDPQARALAQQIVDAQRAELREMGALLGS